MHAEDLIDLNYLAEVEEECEHDRELLREYLDLLRAMAEQERAAIEHGASSGDRPSVVAAAHRLKGGAANVACRRLSRACAAIEANPASAAAMLPEVSQALAESLRFLEQRWSDGDQAITD